MESKYQRQIKSGTEYDSYFPKATGNDTTIMDDAGVEDTVQLIKKTVPKTLEDTRKIAQHLKGRTLNETCRNIWNFVYNHIQYRKDKKGVEQVRRPRRVWMNRFTGVDCDCYTEFISSILMNLEIPHKYRIAIYNPAVGYQHIYPIVPKDGKLNYSLNSRDDYIVIDCVKDEYDSEQPYLQIKDYNMQLDYLDGIEENENQKNTGMYNNNSDAQALASIYDEDQELGSWWSRVTNTNGLKRTVAKAATVVKQAVHEIDRYANPATILLRNGFLASMKLNLFGVAHKLRYAYLSDAQAKAMNINLDVLQHLRNIKDKAETIYWQAGGLKENLKKGILTGKGNKDNQVPLNGLDGLGALYADQDEYDIVNMPVHGLGELGEPVTMTAITAASAAVGAIALTLKQIKGLFTKGSPAENKFQSENPDPENGNGSNNVNPQDLTILNNGEQNNLFPNQGGRSSLPARFGTSPQSAPTSQNDGSASMPQSLVPMQANSQDQNGQSEGIVSKATAWVKEHPMQATLIGGAIAGTGYMLYKNHHEGHHHPLHGLFHHHHHKKKKRKKAVSKSRKNSKRRKTKLKAIKL